MSERVAICAVAQTKYSPDRRDAHEGELVYESVKQVLDETGLTLSDFDSAVTSSQDFWDGRTISSMNLQEFVGAHLSHEDKVAEDSINAVFCAAAQVLSGHVKTVLISTHMKESQAEKPLVENAAFDAIFMRELGLDYLSAAALQAKRHRRRSAATNVFGAFVDSLHHLHLSQTGFTIHAHGAVSRKKGIADGGWDSMACSLGRRGIVGGPGGLVHGARDTLRSLISAAAKRRSERFARLQSASGATRTAARERKGARWPTSTK